jgi:hypothetical protein
LKRAKSTEGVPLINDVVVPLESIALTLSIGTVNETTLAAGASVPTIKAGPVAAFDEPPTLPTRLLAQPDNSNAAAVNDKNAMGKDLTRVLESIWLHPSLILCFLEMRLLFVPY